MFQNAQNQIEQTEQQESPIYQTSEVTAPGTEVDENGNERYVTVPDSLLTDKDLDVGSEWIKDFKR